jgi:hypothetical protein
MTRCNGVNFEDDPNNFAAILSRDAMTCSGASNLRFSACPTVSKAKPPVASASSASKRISSFVSVSVMIAASTIAPYPLKRSPPDDHLGLNAAGPDAGFMLHGLANWFAASRIPQSRRPIFRSGHHQLTVD